LLRSGNYEDPTEKIGLLSAALKENGGAEPELIVSLLAAAQAPLRLAALGACENRQEPEILEAIKGLIGDSDSRVRQKIAEIMPTLPFKQFCEELKKLVQDKEYSVRLAAIRSTAGHPEFLELQQKALASESHYDLRLAVVEVMGSQEPREVFKSFLMAVADNNYEDIQAKCAEWIEQKLEPGLEEINIPDENRTLAKAERALQEIGADRFPKLALYLRSKTAGQVDLEGLAKFGTDLTALAESNQLPPGYCIQDTVRLLQRYVTSESARSIVLLGESGVGKTAAVNALVYELMKPKYGGWRVLRITPADFLTDTKYLGEWETKLRDIVYLARKPRRVLLYIPNIGELSSVGRSSSRDNNVATSLSPYIEEGSIRLRSYSGSFVPNF